MDFFGVGGGTLRRPSKAGISLPNIKKYSTFAIVKARKPHQKTSKKVIRKLGIVKNYAILSNMSPSGKPVPSSWTPMDSDDSFDIDSSRVCAVRLPNITKKLTFPNKISLDFSKILLY